MTDVNYKSDCQVLHMNINPEYISAGCNVSATELDWGNNDLIAYGSCNNIILQNPNFKKGNGCSSVNIMVLNGRTSPICSVSWITNRCLDGDIELIGADYEGYVLVWRRSNSVIYDVKSFKAHAEAISTITAISIDCPYSDLIIATSCVLENSVKIWKRKLSGDIICTENYNYEDDFCCSLRLSTIAHENHSKILLACGMQNHNVNLYLSYISHFDKDENLFRHIKTINTQHKNWITSIDFARIHCDIICTENYNYEDDFCCSLRLSTIAHENHSKILLACGMQNHNVNLYLSYISHFDKDENLFRHIKTINTQHKNWITSIDFARIHCNSDIALATGSADGTIKIWCIILSSATDPVSSEHGQLKVQLQSTLCGHTAAIYTVRFSPKVDESGYCRLLSASVDCTILIWKIRLDGTPCVVETSVGKSSFDNLGFLGAAFNPTGTAIAAYDHQGNLVIWKQTKSFGNIWLPQTADSGHRIDVIDIRWDPTGQFLVSAGKDKSVRVHCPRKGYSDPNKGGMVWTEFARAQLHGYCMSCIAVLPDCRFVSGGDEKILRGFVAPRKFVENCRKFSYLDSDPDDFNKYTIRLQTLNLSADVESTTADDTAVEDSVAYIDGVPVSTVLPEQTLWPEICKMYSHTDDVVALAATSDGCFIASSCKGSNVNECAIVLWDANTWKEMQKLRGHSLTVTQLEFSPDNQFLLSVGRDRRWTLFKCRDEGVIFFDKIDEADEQDCIHRRLLLCCAWSHDGRYFATGSREGKLIIWGRRCRQNEDVADNLKVYKLDDNTGHFVAIGAISPDVTRHVDKRKLKYERDFDAVAVFPFDNKVGVTAVTFAPGFVGGMSSDYYLIAIGFTDGLIRYVFWNTNGCCNDYCTPNAEVKINSRHNKQINRLVFRPQFGRPGYACADKKTLLLASGGDDSLLCIHCLQFSNSEINGHQE